MESFTWSLESLSIRRNRSNSDTHSSPPSIYPTREAPEDTLPINAPPPRPATSASTNRPNQSTLQRAYVVIGATQSCVAILPAPRPQTTASGTPLLQKDIKSAPPSIFNLRPTRPRTITRRKSSASIQDQSEIEQQNLEKYLRGTKTVEEYRREMELELIKRNIEREKEKESSWNKIVGKMKKKLLDDEYDGVQVVYMTAKEAAEREWAIQSQIKSKALMSMRV